jgi:signal transduction histidine kinase
MSAATGTEASLEMGSASLDMATTYPSHSTSNHSALPRTSAPRLHRFSISGRNLTPHAVQRLLARVGDRAAVNLAHMNARLEADRRATLRELRASRVRTVQAVEEERRRLERDLHDGAQQRLIALRIHLGLAAERVAHEPQAGPLVFNELAHEAQEALEDLRQLVRHAHPPLLKHDGLIAALRAVVEATPAHAELDAPGLGRHRPDVEEAVYFTCLEALQNAAKHAGPDTAVTLHRHERAGWFCFEVTDTGPGFDPTHRHPSGGLANMRDRIDALGGELTIASTPAHGTTIAGSVPPSWRRE